MQVSTKENFQGKLDKSSHTHESIKPVEGNVVKACIEQVYQPNLEPEAIGSLTSLLTLTLCMLDK